MSSAALLKKTKDFSFFQILWADVYNKSTEYVFDDRYRVHLKSHRLMRIIFYLMKSYAHKSMPIYFHEVR